MRQKRLLSDRGFSLIELSIVLVVAGLVIAGIWIVMSTVNQNAREARLTSQVTEIMGNGRRVFGRASELPNVSGTGPFTRASITAGVFPADMVRNDTTAIHALGSNAYLAYAFSGTPVLNLTLAGIRADNCSKLVTKVVGSANVREQYGINALIIGATSINLSGDIPVRDLVNACSSGGTGGFNVTFQFTIL